MNGGEFEALLSVVEDGLRTIAGKRPLVSRLYGFMLRVHQVQEIGDTESSMSTETVQSFLEGMSCTVQPLGWSQGLMRGDALGDFSRCFTRVSVQI